ncbi:hypothetical protein J7F01_29645 [Streptomyces sp. ISL-22]|uniref:jacalin family lectin n=1 Tax=unclassified Streptomyces TaxID=2593676 RepID=UPI001BE88697|nr:MULTISPECIES: jacalin family lectin [unclassified Streptomyces]MBT2416344.1 hypothetical protein [Streptomyces sp. ISL-24]MBT2436253.1 hypothetical protein [Streptomyces sp. ISL-22]
MGYLRSNQYGGRGGAEFADNLTEITNLASVTIRHANLVDSIECTWRKTDGSIQQGPRHGGSGGRPDSFALGEGEFITEVEGMHDVWVTQIHFTTNRGRRYGPYGAGLGTGKSSNFTISQNGGGVHGFFGRSGDFLDAVGVYSSVGGEATIAPSTEGLTVCQRTALQALPGTTGKFNFELRAEKQFDPSDPIKQVFTAPTGFTFTGRASFGYYLVTPRITGNLQAHSEDGGRTLVVTHKPHLNTGADDRLSLIYTFELAARADAQPGTSGDGKATIGDKVAQLTGTILPV